jgi:predicted SAM-dependent methyltransferase
MTDMRSYAAIQGYVAPRSRLGAVSRRLPPSLVYTLRSRSTSALHPMSRRQFPGALARSGGRLHLGCGDTPIAGWLNVDLLGSRADVFWDLRHSLPVADGCVRAVFHEHLLEHLPLRDGLRLTEECHRVLTPGGVLRVVVPDAEQKIQEYVERDAALLDNAPTHLIGAQNTLSNYGHVSMYDWETLRLLLSTAGFAKIEHSAFGETALSPSPDDPGRRPESLYVEATKPC